MAVASQPREALRLANQRRLERAELRARVPRHHATSRRFVARLVRQSMPAVEGMELRELLRWVYKPEPTRAEFTDRVMAAIGVRHVDKRVRELTERQRLRLAAMLEASR